MKDYMKKRYDARRKLAFDLIGRVCGGCNLSFADSELELDHIDPKTKTLDFAKKWNVKEETYLEELKKAQPLCKPCHTEKSITDSGKSKAVHGTYAMYRHYKCRCVLCKKANTEMSKKYKKKKPKKTT